MKKKTIPQHSPEAKHIPMRLAIRFLDVAIEMGATYGEIRKACDAVPSLLERATSPTMIAVGIGEREIGIDQR